MKVRSFSAGNGTRPRPGDCRAFTLAELLVSSAVALMVMAGAMGFIYYTSKSLSGVTSQTFLNQEAGKATEFVFGRVRLATGVAVDASGNALTLAFDDDLTKDGADKDGKGYNDKDHFEQFQFRNGDGNDLTTTNNTLVYFADTNRVNSFTLLRSGVRKLGTQRVFALTNVNTVLINLGLVDSYTRDFYQSVDVQLVAVPRNRPTTTNMITILP